MVPSGPGFESPLAPRGQIATKVAKHVAEPIWAPESRFLGIRWGNRHGFSRSICSDRSLGAQMGGGVEYFRGVDGEGRVAKILAGHAGSRKFQKGVNVVTVSGATCRATLV